MEELRNDAPAVAVDEVKARSIAGFVDAATPGFIASMVKTEQVGGARTLAGIHGCAFLGEERDFEVDPAFAQGLLGAEGVGALVASGERGRDLGQSKRDSTDQQ
jgi:hypothetical protein